MSIFLVRHGETEWSKAHKHTGRTDIPLTDRGREAARALGPKLADKKFVRVLSSPLSRAFETTTLAGFGDRAEKTDALLEWDYGDCEGLLTSDIRKTVPGWTVFSHGCPNGESAADVARRVDPLIEELAAEKGDVLLFAHAHVLRVLAARWIGMGPEGGRSFTLDTASISVLDLERETRIIRHWNV